jgi:hypothetical protein
MSSDIVSVAFLLWVYYRRRLSPQETQDTSSSLPRNDEFIRTAELDAHTVIV